jgi:hypothetical protein
LANDIVVHEVTSDDITNGFKRVVYSSPASKTDSNQSTFFMLENRDGKNSEKSETIKHTNNRRVVIAPNSIASASFNRTDGIRVQVSRLFYTGNDQIYFSVLAKPSSLPSTALYSTTNVINVSFNPSAELDESVFTQLVTQIYGVGLEDLTQNTQYSLVLVASSNIITAANAVTIGRRSEEATMSIASNVVKGQVLVSLPSSPLTTFATSNFNVVEIKAPEKVNIGGLRVTGAIYTETRLDNPLNPPTTLLPDAEDYVAPTAANYLKSHQYWTLTKISSDGVSKQLGSDLTQFTGVNESVVLEKLKSFTVVPEEVDDESSYQLTVYEALALLPSMLTCFPGLKTDSSVILYNKNYYYLLNSGQSISFKDLVDPDTIDPVQKVTVNFGMDTDDYDFLAVCMSHVPLSNEQLAVSKICFEVSTSSAFSSSLFISGRSDPTLMPAMKILEIPQAADLSEYQRLWLFDDNGTVTEDPVNFCEGASYHVRVTYVARQKGYTSAVKGSHPVIANIITFENSARLLAGADSVNAFADSNTKKINGSYTLPSSLPAGYSLDRVKVALYGSDFVKDTPLKTRILTRTGSTSIPNTFMFDLSDEQEIQKESYNILVTLVLRSSADNTTIDSTAVHTSVSFSNAIEILGYQISSTSPTRNYLVSEIAGIQNLIFNVKLSGPAQSVLVLFPRVGGNVLTLVPVSNTNGTEWQATFTALPTTLDIEPLILAVGFPGTGYAISPEC